MTRFLANWMLPVALLAGVYSLALGSVNPVDVATGLVIGAGALWGTRARLGPRHGTPEPGPSPSVGRRLLGMPPFAWAVLCDVVAGTWSVALMVLGSRRRRRAGIVAVPIGERTRTGLAVTALATTLSPGSFLTDVDEERGLMLFHVVDLQDPDAVRARHARMYDKYQRHVFP